MKCKAKYKGDDNLGLVKDNTYNVQIDFEGINIGVVSIEGFHCKRVYLTLDEMEQEWEIV